MDGISQTKQCKGRPRTCIYREREIVIVTCPTCLKPRLIQHRPHWKNNIPLVECQSCALKRTYKNRQPAQRLKDFDAMLDTLEIVQAYYTAATPLMVRTTVNAMLRAYRKDTAAGGAL